MYKLSKADRQAIEAARGHYDPTPQWYAVMLHCGRERKVHDRLLRDFAASGLDELLLPEVKYPEGHGPLSGQSELLCLGHLLVRCRMNDDLYMGVTDDPEVYKILGQAWRIPSTIAEREIEIFKGILESYPTPRLVSRVSSVGSVAHVIEGLMKGLCGRVAMVTSQYVKIETSLTFLNDGDGVLVAVPRHQVRIEQPILAGAPEPESLEVVNN